MGPPTTPAPRSPPAATGTRPVLGNSICNLRQRAAQYAHDFFARFVLETFTPENCAKWLEDPAQRTLVWQEPEGIAGFIRLHFASPAPTDADADAQLSTEIATFYIQPRHHGKGIGKALLRAAADACADRGAADIWLATNAENDPAIGFYLAQGFAQIGETHFRVQDQCYLNNVYACAVGTIRRDAR